MHSRAQFLLAALLEFLGVVLLWYIGFNYDGIAIFVSLPLMALCVAHGLEAFHAA